MESLNYSPLLSLPTKIPVLYLQPLPSTADSTTSAFGRTFCEADSPALTTDATFWLAPATKLSPPSWPCNASIKGPYLLDEGVSRVMPGFKDPRNFEGLG